MKLFGKSKPEPPKIQKTEKAPKVKENNLKPAKPNLKPLPEQPQRETETEEEKLANTGLFNRFQKKASDNDLASDKTVIGKSIVVTGEITGGEEVLIEGRVEGNVNSLNKLNIGISGTVDGNIETNELRISGKVKGEINALNLVEVAPTGDVVGKITTPRIVVVEGASIDGNVTTSRPDRVSSVDKNDQPEDSDSNEGLIDQPDHLDPEVDTNSKEEKTKQMEIEEDKKETTPDQEEADAINTSKKKKSTKK